MLVLSVAVVFSSSHAGVLYLKDKSGIRKKASVASPVCVGVRWSSANIERYNNMQYSVLATIAAVL